MAIGVDVMDRGDSPYFKRYLADHQVGDRVRTHWGVDQSDGAALRSVLGERAATLDLVIDDASHLYGPTRAAFEAVFPLVQAGGFYVIEDWGWEHWPAFQGRDGQWADERAMADLIHELIMVSACSESISRILVYKNFVVIERGAASLPSPFDVDALIVRRNRPADSTAAARAKRRAAGMAERFGRRAR